jgi:3-phosphoshikimate 1-carboxyvinyltransferase
VASLNGRGARPLAVEIPGDKSLSHRALILAALATGTSQIRGLLDSADVRATAECLRRLGVSVPPISPEMSVTADGVGGFRDAKMDLDCANSGTSARLLSGIVAGAGISARFVGDASLSKRPMRRVADPLRQMGADIRFEGAEGLLPMCISAGKLGPIEWTSPTASAQVKSALLLAGVTARVAIVVREPSRSRDHTERMLAALGAPINVSGAVVRLAADCPPLEQFAFDVPGDPSSAAFFAAWALLSGAPLRTGIVSVNPTRIGFFRVLQRAGAEVSVEPEGFHLGEPIGRIAVRGRLGQAFTLGEAEVPTLIDELPLLACLAVRTPGETRVTGAAELRAKESDRIATVVNNLRGIGAQADELPDGFVVHGTTAPLRGSVTTHGDHRIAMAFGVLGAEPGNQIAVDDPACVDVSFPRFWLELERLRAA